MTADDLTDALEIWLSSYRKRGIPREDALGDVFKALNRDRTLRNVWLALAVFNGGLPTDGEVRHAHRALARQTAQDFFKIASKRVRAALRRGHTIELLRSAVIVDVRHTAETDLATGIQRVARETVRRWQQSHDVTLVTWTRDGRSMRRLVYQEQQTAIEGTTPKHKSTVKADRRVVVPVDGYYILPELAAEQWRTARIAALAEYSHTVTCVIGFDCVPLTTAETVGDGMPGAFARNLGAVSRMGRIAAISDAAAIEYRGWRRMLAASGVRGPDIVSILLAAEPGRTAEQDRDEFSQLIGLTELPLVLVVGSHEPRKNHLAVLQAAELAWREGLNFQLIFVGGNSWNSVDFSERIETLRLQGRPTEAVSALPDRLLWAAYSLSRFTIFTSINEGFGLPVAESLAMGTPVITSNYGSMQQIAATGGAITVDPHDDYDILRAIRSLLVDEDRYIRLRNSAKQYSTKTWDTYADELWRYFLSGE